MLKNITVYYRAHTPKDKHFNRVFKGREDRQKINLLYGEYPQNAMSQNYTMFVIVPSMEFSTLRIL